LPTCNLCRFPVLPLAFRTYGLDVLERLRAAGFEARVERVDDRRHAIVTDTVVVGRTPE
jgi:hypothetical protein